MATRERNRRLHDGRGGLGRENTPGTVGRGDGGFADRRRKAGACDGERSNGAVRRRRSALRRPRPRPRTPRAPGAGWKPCTPASTRRRATWAPTPMPWSGRSRSATRRPMRSHGCTRRGTSSSSRPWPSTAAGRSTPTRRCRQGRGRRRCGRPARASRPSTRSRRRGRRRRVPRAATAGPPRPSRARHGVLPAQQRRHHRGRARGPR